MTLLCTGGSSWCFLSRCRIFLLRSATPHIQPTFSQAGGRGYGGTVAPVSPVLSTCRRKMEGRFPQTRGGRRHIRPLPVALMQKIVKDNVARKTQQTTKMRNLSVHLFPGSYFGIGPLLKISTERRGQLFA